MKIKDLNKGLLYIMENYLIEKEKAFKDNKIAKFLRNDIEEIIEDIILDLSKSELLIKGSPGQGMWAEIPWVCIFNKDITISAQKGIYLVFLFSSDMSRVYLSLNQGYTFYRENKIVDRIEEFSSKIRSIVSDYYDLSEYKKEINLKAKGHLGKGYESCNIISKLYTLDSLKNDKVDIEYDLLELIEIYDHIYRKLPNQDIDLFYEKLYSEIELNSSYFIEEDRDISYLNLESSKEMINHIDEYIKGRGFIFDKEDISNLYLSMKTKPFVLLAGISGTGKSKIVELFASAIGATSENGRYRLISVKPDWNDASELLGYIDIKGDYIPGILTEIVYEANKKENLHKPYIICLDEMNLARVEYYLSDYLSLIETRHRKDGEVRTSKIFSNTYLNSESIYKDIYFSDNIHIIGTVNMDDTTFSFSEKVLDRANTIEFSKVYLDHLDFDNYMVEEMKVSNENFKTSYLTIRDAVLDNRNFVERVNTIIIDINNILEKHNKHFAYRTRDEIVFYMLENDKSGLLDFEAALDYQILQKILPRINGNDYGIKIMLIELFNYLNSHYQIKDSHNYLENINMERLNYNKSSKKIIDMLGSYENGYVSFW